MGNITPEQQNVGDKVIEAKRKIVFCSGQHLNLRDVTRIEVGGTWWRIWHSEGLSIVDPAKVDYVTVV